MAQQRPAGLQPQQPHQNAAPSAHPQHAQQGPGRRVHSQGPGSHQTEEAEDDTLEEEDIAEEAKDLAGTPNEETGANNSQENADLQAKESPEGKTTEKDTKTPGPEAPADAIPKERTTHGTTTTGWADAARGAKHKPAYHGNVQYSHERPGQAGERRVAATARRQPQQQQHRNPPSSRYRVEKVPMAEFDFEKANSLFDKAKIKQELLKGVSEETQGTDSSPAVVPTPLPTKSYDKATSFFDSLSCDSLAEDDGSKRSSYAEQRRLNAETFGVHSISDGRSHRPQNDNRGGNRQYQRRSNGANGHGNYAGNRGQNSKRVFVPKNEGAGKK